MRLLRLSAMVAASALLVAISAMAQEEHSPGLWHLSHLSDPVSGKFNYCAVESSFDNGLTLAFARNRDFNTNIVVSFPDKRLEEHSRYKMLVAVDTNPVRDVDAFSADPSILVVPLQHDRKLLDWLQKGKLLELKGPQDSVKFALDGANDAFHKLQACVEQGLKDETGHVAGPVPPAKDVQIATAEAAQPMAPDMVMPLPLPDAAQAAPAAQAPAAGQTEAANTVTPSPQSPAPQSPTPPSPVPSVAAAAPAQPAAEAAPAPAQAAAASASPSPTGVSPALQRFLDKRQTQPQQAASGASDAGAQASQPAPQPPVVAAASPEQPALPQPAVPGPVAPAKPAAAPATLPAIAAVLQSAGIQPSDKCSDASASCTWHNGVETGSILKVSAGKALLDTMLDDTDRREKSCKGKFTAENGAPITRGGIEWAEAIYTCDATFQAALYARGTDKSLVFDETVPADKLSAATVTRRKIASSMGIATNYQ